GGGHHGEDGDETGGSRLGGPPLVLPEIAAALHRDLARGPRLLGRPLDGIHAVLLVVEEGLPAALRLVASADVLEDVDVAALREVDGGVVGGWEALGAVGSPRHEDGVLALSDRTVDVGEERHAVAHADGHAVLELYVVAGTDVGRETHSTVVGAPGGRPRRQGERRQRQEQRPAEETSSAPHRGPPLGQPSGTRSSETRVAEVYVGPAELSNEWSAAGHPTP